MGPSRSNVAVVALAGLELDLQGDVMDAAYFLQHPGQRLADLFGIDLSADEHHVGGQDRLARSQSPCMQRSDEHTSDLQSLMRSSYAVFCLKKKTRQLCITRSMNSRRRTTKPGST